MQRLDVVLAVPALQRPRPGPPCAGNGAGGGRDAQVLRSTTGLEQQASDHEQGREGVTGAPQGVLPAGQVPAAVSVAGRRQRLRARPGPAAVRDRLPGPVRGSEEPAERQRVRPVLAEPGVIVPGDAGQDEPGEQDEEHGQEEHQAACLLRRARKAG